MKNLTISIPDDVYRDARIRAAERGMSVSRMVADYLRSLSDAEERRLANNAKRRALVKRIHQRQRDEGVFFSMKDNLSREELYNERFDRKRK